MAWQNFIKDNSNTLLEAGIGLVGGRTAAEQASGGLLGFRNGARANKTMKFLQESNPELAQMVQSGAIEAGDAYKLHYQQQMEAKKAAMPDRQFVELADGTYGYADKNKGDFLPLGKANKPANLPSSVDEYNFAKQQGYGGSYMDFTKDQKAPGVVINNGDPADGNLNKALDLETGKNWAAFQQQGGTSASNLQDFNMIEPLLDVAPQGPLTGALAKQFPGFSSAGDVINSTVKRIAPTLRTPGSGSTSDVEYDGFLKSLPDLGTSPEGNKAINSVMKAKAQINIDRSKIVDAFQAKKISREQALLQLQEINSRSIMTPEVQAILSGSPRPQGAEVPNPEIDNLLQKYGG